MALGKESVDSKGVVGKYHRIFKYEIDLDSRQVIAYVKKYADESFRKMEKKHITEQAEIDKLYSDLKDLVSMNDDANTEEIVELTDRINELVLNRDIVEDRFISIDLATFDYDINKEYTFRTLYDELKMTENYIDAEDV